VPNSFICIVIVSATACHTSAKEVRKRHIISLINIFFLESGRWSFESCTCAIRLPGACCLLCQNFTNLHGKLVFVPGWFEPTQTHMFCMYNMSQTNKQSSRQKQRKRMSKEREGNKEQPGCLCQIVASLLPPLASSPLISLTLLFSWLSVPLNSQSGLLWLLKH
jgi:hypothetical protein